MIDKETIQILFSNVPTYKGTNCNKNIARQYNINNTIYNLFQTLEEVTTIPSRYFRFMYNMNSYTFMERSLLIKDVFDINESPSPYFIRISLNTQIDKQIFVQQVTITDKVSGRTKKNYINGMASYYNNLPRQLDIRKDYIDYFRKHKEYLIERNKKIIHDEY